MRQPRAEAREQTFDEMSKCDSEKALRPQPDSGSRTVLWKRALENDMNLHIEALTI